MTRVEPRPEAAAAPVPEPEPAVPPTGNRFPWHAAPPPEPAAASAKARSSGEPAGFVTRAAANAVDVVLVTLAVAVGYAAVAGCRFLLAPRSFRLVAPQFAWVVVTVGIGLVLYWTATWAGPGRTYGDELMGLRVVGPRGARLHLLHAAARAVLCVLFLPGLFWVLVSRHDRSVQDVVLRTAVVYD
jgi:uncharacterized RDD family membrane protein YckC